MKKKIKIEDLKPDWEVPPMQYYWCIACGQSGDFERVKHKNKRCEECGYDDLLKLEEDEFKEIMEG